MTEPNVLGNVSPAKFLFDSGNTQIINLWKPELNSSTQSGHFPDEGTEAGQDYIIPVGKVFYLLYIHFPSVSADCQPRIQKNTSPDTATGGTTLFRLLIDSSISCSAGHACYAKFDAGDYVTVYDDQGSSYFWNAWGVECDA